MKNCVFFQKGYCKKGDSCAFVHTQVPQHHVTDLEGDIQRQVEYWISEENLQKDEYLRSHADENGCILNSSLASSEVT